MFYHFKHVLSKKIGAEVKNLGAYFFTAQPHPYGKAAFEKQVFVQYPSGRADKAKSEPISEFGFACFGGPGATSGEPFHITVLVSPDCILLCIQNIPASTRLKA